MNEIVRQVTEFFAFSATSGMTFFNEAELQHELGFWLRTKLTSRVVIYFERPANTFGVKATGLKKKEIDLVISPPDQSWHFAIELKCPRNGRYPETMFDACCDLQFLEELIANGFRGGLFAMHVNDSGYFKSGFQTGVYSYFRDQRPIPPVIMKPTGKRDSEVRLNGNYQVKWQSHGSSDHYWLQPVVVAAERKLER